MQVFLWAEDGEAGLRSELSAAFPASPIGIPGPGLLQVDFSLPRGQQLPWLAYARQWLPEARPMQMESIRAWAVALLEATADVLPQDQPWSLHVEPRYLVRSTHRMGARAWHSAGLKGNPAAAGSQADPAPGTEPGRQRCQLIRTAFLELLQKKRRHWLRRLRPEPGPFSPGESVVQLLLTAPGSGFLSVAPSPVPIEQRHLLSPFPRGEVPAASDKAAPSRAFAKLVEAEARLGHGIRAGESCVDLGASPGSWTYVAANRGAQVVAVDRSELRADLMQDRRVQFQPGDAFSFQPRHPVDWLLCDVIAPAERTAGLLLEWLKRGWCRKFIVTLKLQEAQGQDALRRIKSELPSLTRELFLLRLCANKKEICAFGCRREG
jgi:23S rRNA (cytidine2498-2'-O)-methyltransferase